MSDLNLHCPFCGSLVEVYNIDWVNQHVENINCSGSTTGYCSAEWNYEGKLIKRGLYLEARYQLQKEIEIITKRHSAKINSKFWLPIANSDDLEELHEYAVSDYSHYNAFRIIDIEDAEKVLYSKAENSKDWI